MIRIDFTNRFSQKNRIGHYLEEGNLSADLHHYASEFQECKLLFDKDPRNSLDKETTYEFNWIEAGSTLMERIKLEQRILYLEQSNSELLHRVEMLEDKIASVLAQVVDPRMDYTSLRFFPERLSALSLNGEVDKSLDLIFETFDNLFDKHNFQDCDELLQSTNLELLETVQAVTILVATLPAKEQLKFRRNFYERVLKHLSMTHSSEKVTSLLSGLE